MLDRTFVLTKINHILFGDNMKANMGNLDRIFRIILGVVVIVLGFIYESWWGLVGLVPIVTSFVSWCPIYVPFGLSTIFKQKDA